MATHPPLMAAVLGMLGGALVLAGCDPGYGVGGKVIDCDTHEPIVGVRVEMFDAKTASGHVTVTDYTEPTGEFEVDNFGLGDHAITLRLTKRGHVTREVHLAKAPEHHVEYCLQLLEPMTGGDSDAGDDGDAGSDDAH